MDPRYMDNLEKNTFKPCTPTMKKIVKRGVFLAYWRLISLLSFEKELGWGERLVQHTIFGLDFYGKVRFGPLEVEIILKLQFP